MNRKEEYQALLAELQQTPPELETTLQRAEARQRNSCRRHWLSVPAGSLAACFLAFVLLVNLFPPFAKACSAVPVLGRLAEAVSWSPTLSAAVEHDYVQPMGLSQTENGITATVEYLIVDQKQVNIFYTLDGPYDKLAADMPEFLPEQRCSTISSGFPEPPGTMQQITMDYGDTDVPDRFTMLLSVFGENEADRAPYQAPDRLYEDEMLEPVQREEPEILASFRFELTFDPNFTDKGERIQLDQCIRVDGQTLTVTDIEVYPTHVRVNITGAPENTAWLKGLEFYLENEDGLRFEPISNGVSGTGAPDKPEMASFRLESPYFASSRHLTLYITGATWLDKDMERVRVDLAHETADRLPEGVSIASFDHREGGWVLYFRAAYRKESSVYQVWSMTYYDAEGNSFETGRYGSSTGSEGIFEVMLPLPDYHGEEVWLEPAYSRTTREETPVAVPVK